MAFVALNGFDVEHVSNLVMENLFPEIQTPERKRPNR